MVLVTLLVSILVSCCVFRRLRHQTLSKGSDIYSRPYFTSFLRGHYLKLRVLMGPSMSASIRYSICIILPSDAVCINCCKYIVINKSQINKTQDICFRPKEVEKRQGRKKKWSHYKILTYSIWRCMHRASYCNVYISRTTRCTNSYNVSLFIIKCSTCFGLFSPSSGATFWSCISQLV